MKIITFLTQPMTAKQLAHLTRMREDCCSYILHELLSYHLVRCLNSLARRSRLYWLTNRGKEYQRKLLKDQNLTVLSYNFPVVNWQLYGWSCYNHRSAVIKTITEPMKSSQIRRKIIKNTPDVKISTNNVADITQLLLAKGVIEVVQIHNKSHIFYRLTETGRKIRQLLLRAESG